MVLCKSYPARAGAFVSVYHYAQHCLKGNGVDHLLSADHYSKNMDNGAFCRYF